MSSLVWEKRRLPSLEGVPPSPCPSGGEGKVGCHKWKTSKCPTFRRDRRPVADWTANEGTASGQSTRLSPHSPPQFPLDFVLIPFQRENLHNNTHYPASVHAPIGGIFGNRGDARCPRTRTTRLPTCAEERTGSTRNDQIGANE